MVSFIRIGCSSIIYNLLDNGVANLLGLETLRHGTNLVNYLSIRLKGGDPSHGGKDTGSTANHFNDNTKDFFYLFKDSEFDGLQNSKKFSDMFRRELLTRNLSGQHAAGSTINLANKIIPCSQKDSKITKLFKNILKAFIIVTLLSLTPSVCFRFSKIDPNRLANDPRYGESAYKTSMKVEAWRIGFLGTLLTGINKEWLTRIKANPSKLLVGVIQLTSALALTALSINLLAPTSCFSIGIGILIV